MAGSEAFCCLETRKSPVSRRAEIFHVLLHLQSTMRLLLTPPRVGLLAMSLTSPQIDMTRAGTVTMSMIPTYSDTFSAANVWECDVPMQAIDKAAALFSGIRSKEAWDWDERGNGEPAARRVQRQFSTKDGRFFELRREGWRSDISWVSADDEKTHGSLREVFEAFKLDKSFGDLVPGDKLRMFGAFYVVRSDCKEHNWHCDFVPKTFPALLTLITPLHDCVHGQVSTLNCL